MNKELINKIKTEFEYKFTQHPLLVRSPGRINLIGEHTDYNMGLVFPATIDKCIIIALAKSNKNISKIYSRSSFGRYYSPNLGAHTQFQ